MMYLGPIATPWYERTANAGGSADGSWVQSFSFAGSLPWQLARQLRELVANRDRRVTIAGATGVLEYAEPDCDALADWRGWYLFASFAASTAHINLVAAQPSSFQSLGTRAPAAFTLNAFRIDAGRQLVVVPTSRHLGNDFGLIGQPIVVDPYLNEDSAGGQMLVSIGGSTVAREYDPST